MSKEPDSPAVFVVDAAQPSQDFSLLPGTSTQAMGLSNPHAPGMSRQNSILDPDHFVFKLKFEDPDTFLEVVISHLSRFLDLPGSDLENLRISARNEMRPSASKSFKKWGFMKKKETKGVVFGVPLTDESLVQIQNLTDFLESHLDVEGIFRKPGNANRLVQLRAALNTGVCVDLQSSNFHSHDIASILKTYLGELPEPLLRHKYFKCHLQVAQMMAFDVKGNITQQPDKARRIESLQLLILLLPTVNRTLLRGILNLLYQTAKNQKSNKMNAANLATMFCPHLLWPRNLKTSDLQSNLGKLNDHLTFMIRHSQKIFAAPQYIRDAARAKFRGFSLSAIEQQQSVTITPSGAVKRTSSGRKEYSTTTSSYTEKALQELYEQVKSMPNSAKKKKLVKNMEKQSATPSQRQHKRSRTFGGLIKKKVLSVTTPRGDGTTDKQGFVHIPQPGSGSLMRPRNSLSRRKSACSSKKLDNNNKGLKERYFKKSLKVDHKASNKPDDSEATVASALMTPIPFPSLDDGPDKENDGTQSVKSFQH